MEYLGESMLIDAIVDAREGDAVRIAARMLRTGVALDAMEGICSEAMQAIGSGFTPCPACIDEVAAANQTVDQILNLEILVRS